MKRMSRTLMAALLALLAGGAWAQAIDTPAGQAVVRISRAIGLAEVVATEEPAALLAAMRERMLISPSTEELMTAALGGQAFTGDQLAIFVEDVLNGPLPAPATAAEARIALIGRGLILEAFFSDEVTLAELDALFSSMDFAQSVAASYLAPASPVRPDGN